MAPPIKLYIDYSLQGMMIGVDLAIYHSFTSKDPVNLPGAPKNINNPKVIQIE